MLGTIHASNSFSTFLVATFVFVPVGPSSVRPPTGHCRQWSDETDAGFRFICLQLSMIYAGCLEDTAWWGSQNTKLREAPNFALIGNVNRLNHSAPHPQDLEPQIPLEAEIFSLGRPPNHECSEHKSGKMMNFTYHFVIRYEIKIWSRHPARLLCLIRKCLSVGMSTSAWSFGEPHRLYNSKCL